MFGRYECIVRQIKVWIGLIKISDPGCNEAIPYMTKPSTLSPAITSAADFWTGIRTRGGLMTAARARGKRNYDADIEQRIVDALELPGNHITSILLKKHSVSLEQFVDAVFSALEPWAILMTETLAMFAEAEASHGGDGINIEIRLDELGAGLRTTLAAFEKESRVTQQIVSSSRGKQWGEIDTDELWSVSRSLPSRTAKAQAQSPSPVRAWGTRQREWSRTLPGGREPPPRLPITGDPDFDALRADASALLSSFMKAVRKLGATSEARWKVFSPDDGYTAPLLADGWGASKVASLDSDFIMVSLYESLDHLATTGGFQTANGRRSINTWHKVLEAVPTGSDASEQAERLLSLLDLPCWKARHQLYAVWAATRIVKAAPWPPKWTLTDDTLNFDFGGAEIARFNAEDIVLVLRSELQRPLIGKSSGKRKKAIQPDFTLLLGSDANTSPAHLVLECKQYRNSSRGNFRAALEDYSRSHPGSDVLLSNYGPIRESVFKGLGTASRDVRGFGEVHPQGIGLNAFDDALLASFNRAKEIIARQKEAVAARRLSQFMAPCRTSPDVGATQISFPNPGNVTPLASISLAWEDGGDLDLHVHLQSEARPYVINFSDRGRADGAPYAILDQDVTSGPGKETLSLYAPLQDDLRIEVHLYSGSWPSTPPSVTLIKPDGWSRTFVRSDNETSDLWEVGVLKADWLTGSPQPIC